MTKKQRYAGVLAWFAENVPAPRSELRFDNAWQLLVAVVLSAQCTDRRVNLTTPALFERFPSAVKLAQVDEDEIYPYIRSISYPNNKARNLAKMARQIVERYGGEVPTEQRELEALSGVGRKTANVLGAVLWNRPLMAVDTHVYRVSRRLGLVPQTANTPLKVERELTKNIPPELIPRAHHWLILHGRYVCTARKPACAECGISAFCKYFVSLSKV